MSLASIELQLGEEVIFKGSVVAQVDVEESRHVFSVR